jgi:hypothetical protein
MGFWNDLKNASPNKGVARGRELHAARIRSITSLKDETREAIDQGIDIPKCEVCHATFGAAFFKDAYPCGVSISPFDHLSFGENPPNFFLCNKCVETFDLVGALQRTKAEDGDL